MSSQCSFNSPAGTLHAFYRFTQEKQKLDHFAFEKSGQTTEIALSKVWINGCPAIYLKGFKSTPMAEEGVQFALGEDVCNITLQNSAFCSIDVTIKILGEGEKILKLRVLENLKITGLKKIIAKELGMDDSSSLNLQYNESDLTDSITLRESGFNNGLELTLKLFESTEENGLEKGKLTCGPELGGGFAFVECIIAEKKKSVPFAETGPKWVRVYDGLNLQTECTTKACDAFHKIIYIQKGMGTFDMAKESCRAACPQCSKTTTAGIKNFGFVNCMYSIFGTTDNGTVFERKNEIAPKTAYLTFEEIVDGQTKMAKWKYLEIITEPFK